MVKQIYWLREHILKYIDHKLFGCWWLSAKEIQLNSVILSGMHEVFDIVLFHPILNTIFEIFTWNYFFKSQWLPIEWISFVTIGKERKHYAQPKIGEMLYFTQFTKCNIMMQKQPPKIFHSKIVFSLHFH